MSYFFDKNMNVIELPEGVTPLEIYVSSIEKDRATSRIEGRNGKIDNGYTFVERDILIRLMLKGKDRADYQLLYDEIYNLFGINNHMYVVEPLKPGKRFLVSIDQRYTPNKLNPYTAIIEIECSTVELPFAESIGTSADIDRNGILYSQELWSYGMGLLHDEESHRYTHNTSTFRIFNPGIEVHPFEQQLKITINNASKDYQLKNKTTNEIFKVTDDMTGNLILDGANVLNNNLQSLRKTNKQFISIKQGWNEFEQNGTNEVSFDFRFYYL